MSVFTSGGLTTLGASPEEAQKVHLAALMRPIATLTAGSLWASLFAGHGGVRCGPNWAHQLY